MATTITAPGGLTTTTTRLVTNDFERPARTIIHEPIGGDDGTPDVTLRAPGPRAGRLVLAYPTPAAALHAEQVHLVKGVLTLTDDDLPTLDMQYVVVGTLGVSRDTSHPRRWLFTTGFQEVRA